MVDRGRWRYADGCCTSATEVSGRPFTCARRPVIAEPFEVADDVRVLAVEDVLVAKRGACRTMADARHERLEARSTRRGEGRGGVSEVVEAEARHVRLSRRRFPDTPAEVAAP